ncbi:MAG: hypothetical protein WCG63_04260 [Opitutaceae bacterium]
MLRRRLINLDLWAGRSIALKLPAYIEERWSLNREGAYTAEEWSHARSAGYRGNEAGRPLLDTEEGYRQQLATHNAPAAQAANRLAGTLDFQRYRTILEIGCGEIAQAYTLTNLFPHLRYRATDFDPFVIEKCLGLPLLNRIEKSVLDVSRIAASDLAGFDLLAGWEIIYALDEPVLHTVLSVCHEAGVPFMAATSQLLGPIRYLRRTWSDTAWGLHGSAYQRLVAKRRLRMHGWNPSLGYYQRQAARAGMRLSRFWLPPPCALDNFSFLLFEPA